MMRRRGNERGFTLLEIVVVLGVLAVLAAILVPMVVGYLDDAKKSKAQADTQQIAAATLKMYKDTGRWPFYQDGTASGSTPVFVLLKGSGRAPSDGTSGTVWTLTATSDTFENQLIKNSPSSGTGYSTSGKFAWRGPYMEAVSDDPWGNYYVANIDKAKPGDNKQVWVISAGPNAKIETTYDATTTAVAALGGDDIGARVQ